MFSRAHFFRLLHLSRETNRRSRRPRLRLHQNLLRRCPRSCTADNWQPSPASLFHDHLIDHLDAQKSIEDSFESGQLHSFTGGSQPDTLAMERDPEAAPLIAPGVTKRQSHLVVKCFAGLAVLLLVLYFAMWLPAGKADIPDRHRRPSHKSNTSLPVVRVCTLKLVNCWPSIIRRLYQGWCCVHAGPTWLGLAAWAWSVGVERMTKGVC